MAPAHRNTPAGAGQAGPPPTPLQPSPPLQSLQPLPDYAELHCRSNFSFLEGASHPEELVEEAARLELEALAITDRDGFYGVVRQSEAANAVGVPAVYGVDLGLVGRVRAQGGGDPALNHARLGERELGAAGSDPDGLLRGHDAQSTSAVQGKPRPIGPRRAPQPLGA